jgi:hypothetical protein
VIVVEISKERKELIYDMSLDAVGSLFRRVCRKMDLRFSFDYQDESAALLFARATLLDENDKGCLLGTEDQMWVFYTRNGYGDVVEIARSQYLACAVWKTFLLVYSYMWRPEDIVNC